MTTRTKTLSRKAAAQKKADAAPRRKAAAEWTREEDAACRAFIFGTSANLPEGRSDRAIKLRFDKELQRLRRLKDQVVPCHAATRKIYATIKASAFHRDGESAEALRLAVSQIFCTKARLARGDQDAAFGRRAAWLNADAETREKFNVR